MAMTFSHIHLHPTQPRPQMTYLNGTHLHPVLSLTLHGTISLTWKALNAWSIKDLISGQHLLFNMVAPLLGSQLTSCMQQLTEYNMEMHRGWHTSFTTKGHCHHHHQNGWHKHMSCLFMTLIKFSNSSLPIQVSRTRSTTHLTSNLTRLESVSGQTSCWEIGLGSKWWVSVKLCVQIKISDIISGILLRLTLILMALHSSLLYWAVIRQQFQLQLDTRSITWSISHQATSPILDTKHMGWG